jgi:hypothetical protein
VECGCGEVLSGLVRRIDREARAISVTNQAGVAEASGILAEVMA